ncbi:MAG: DUF937 domain-containing protein [Streptosporangiaceae bacterium]
MSQSLNDEIMGKLGDRTMAEIASALGTTTDRARETVRAALPGMVDEVEAAVQGAPRPTGMSPKGVALVAGGAMISGAILDRLLKRRPDPASAGIAQRTGISHTQVKSALAILTPIVLSVVNTQLRKHRHDDPYDATPKSRE